MNFILILKYKGKEDFLYQSPCFVADNLDSAIKIAPIVIAEAWEKISPHPPPDEVVNVIAGTMGVAYE